MLNRQLYPQQGPTSTLQCSALHYRTGLPTPHIRQIILSRVMSVWPETHSRAGHIIHKTGKIKTIPLTLQSNCSTLVTLSTTFLISCNAQIAAVWKKSIHKTKKHTQNLHCLCPMMHTVHTKQHTMGGRPVLQHEDSM